MNVDSYKPIPHEKFKKEDLQNPEVYQKYEGLEDEFSLIAEMIKTRKMARKTQREVAEEMCTSQAVVARIENGFSYRQHSPTFNTLKKYARALGCHLLIRLVPERAYHHIRTAAAKPKK